MKKMTKLLSVILAFVMALSCMTVMASAIQVGDGTYDYKTVAGLNTANAYSPYGTVTRLTTEERTFILLDFLDNTLAPLNIKKSMDLSILGTLNLDLTSVNGLCATIDNVKDLLGGFIASIAIGLGIAGPVIKELNIKDNWTTGMRRDNKDQLFIIGQLLRLISGNQSVFSTLFSKGLDLGIVGNFLPIDLKPIDALVKNLPSLVNAIALPLMGRQDDDQAQRTILGTRTSSLIEVAQNFVNGLFTKPMNWTSYRVDAAGNDLGKTLALPAEADGTSRYFVISADKKEITQYDYKYEGILGSPEAGYEETVTYKMEKEYDAADCTTYVYRAPADYNGDKTLKWYKAGDPASMDANNPDKVVDANGRVQSSYWLPTVAKAFKEGKLSLDINGKDDSVLGLIYKFAPYLFAEMAPTVLNGSAKKLIAEAFDVEFTKIGLQGDDAVTAVANDMKNADDKLFFTKDQEYYVWEYSDYKVIDGVPYYRYENQYFKGEIPKNISAYYYMFNWDWNIPGNFMDEYIPDAVGTNKWALDNLNSLIKKAIDAMIAESWTVKGVTYNRSEVFNWSTANGNADLLNNILNCARKFFMIAPEEIVDEYYADAQFYKPMMEGDLKQAVNGLVCELVKLIMPQIKFPNNIVNQPITAIAAVVVRELCTQLMPTYNFDAMIYANYGDASDNVRAIASHTADEWLDISLYMGVNLGMYYLRNIADIGEDQDNGYYSVMEKLGALPALSNKKTPQAADAITFGADAYKTADGTASWLVAIDWIIDWALSDETKAEFAWHFEKLIDCGSTVDLATYQNPFNKLNKVLCDLLPFDQLLNVSAFTETHYGSDTFLEKVLKNGIVDSIVNLDVPSLLSLLKIPDGYFTQGYIADSLVKIVVKLLDNILYRVAGNADIINRTNINSVSGLLNHTNLSSTVVTLVSKLKTAFDNSLFEPVLPIVNLFVGWVMDPQKYSEPSIYLTNDGGDTFFMSSANPKLNIINASSGMLQKHRNSSVEDAAYTIKITNIDGGTAVTTSERPVLAPGEKASIPLTINENDTVAKLTIEYEFTGKDNKPLGGTQTKTLYIYTSSINDQEAEKGRTTDDSNFAVLDNFNKYVFTEDIYTSVTEYMIGISGKAADVGKVDKMQFKSITNTTKPSGLAADYFAQITTAEANSVGGWDTSETTAQSLNGKLYKAKDSSVTADTFALEYSEQKSDEYPNGKGLYGIYDMGVMNLKSRSYLSGQLSFWNNGWKDSAAMPVEVDFIYYNDYNVGDVATKYIDYQLKASDWADTAKYNAYETALKKVVELANYPKRTDYVTTIQPQIKAAIKALESAYEALINSQEETVVDISNLKTALNKVEKNPEKDLNYQDYKLYEYFQYEKQRTNARNMIKSVTPPAAPEDHIDSVWGNDLINAIKAAQTNANVSAGIDLTVEHPTADDDEKYAQALADFKAPVYTELAIEDQIAKLPYYAQFMLANTKTAEKIFLNKEIDYAKAQNYDETLYSADSWARYAAAIANADAVAAKADALQSEVFDAKYELMIAQNKLQLKERSMKEVGYMNEELIPLIQHANAIIANYGSLYTVKSGVTTDEAFAQLVKALGVNYDVTVDGKDYAGILYDRSALTFKEYDRTATAKNKRAVDGAADKLRAAIENFECTAKIESNNAETAVDQTVRYIQGIVPNSLKNVDDLKAKLAVSEGVTPVYTASKANQYGTGARVELKASDAADAELYATYFVVIYGDVNGDGAVDAFDAIEVDHANHTAYYMGDVYDDAADINGDGKVDESDYAAIVAGVQCKGVISQNPVR